MKDRIRVQIAKRLAPEMYAGAVEAGQKELAHFISDAVHEAVREVLMLELYKRGLTEEQMHELIKEAEAKVSMQSDLFVMMLCETAGIELDDEFIPGAS